MRGSSAGCSNECSVFPEASREVVRLDGWWHVWFDDAADWEGETLPAPGTPASKVRPIAPSVGWEGAEDEAESLQVPGTWAASRPGYHGVAWHWRPVFLGEEWCGRTVRLRLAGVRLYCQVYVDGALVGYDYDGLTPFEVDVTDHLVPGRQHTLALRVVNPGGVGPGEPLAPIRWGGRVLPPSHDFGGVWGSVSLVGTGAAHIETVWLETSADGSVARFHVRVRNRGPARSIRLGVSVRAEGSGPERRSKVHELDMPAGDVHAVALDVPVGGLQPWSPEHPQLYLAEVVLSDGQAGDRLAFRSGLARVSYADGRYLLNGQPIEVRAARSEGWYPVTRAFATPSVAEGEVRSARVLGLNALVLDGHVASPGLLDAADRQGLLVVQCPPVAEGSIELSDERLARLLRRDGHHPSMVLGTMRPGQAGSLGKSVRALHLLLDQEPGECGPGVPILEVGPPGLPEVDSVARRYGGRVLPGSDGDVWASWARRVARQHSAHRLERLFTGPEVLARATARLAYRWVGEQVREARRTGAAAGYVLGDWADDIGGAAGVVDPFRALKAEERPLADATAPLALSLSGADVQCRSGRTSAVAVHALNAGRRWGTYELEVRVVAPDGRLVTEEVGWATLSGLEREPLERMQFRPDLVGEYTLRATLARGSDTLCSVQRSVWSTEPDAPVGAGAGGLGVLGGAGIRESILGRLGAGWEEYRLDSPVRSLLVLDPEPAEGLGNVLFSGTIRRVALVAGDLSSAAMGQWARWVPALGSAYDLRDAVGPPWVVGGWHRQLLDGVGDPGIWWHAADGLRPTYVLREPLEETVAVAVCVTRRTPEDAGGPQVGTVLGLGRVGEAELLVCTLPLPAAIKDGQPAAERLMRNIVAWVLGIS